MEGLKRIKGENHIITCRHKGGGRAWRWGVGEGLEGSWWHVHMSCHGWCCVVE